MCECWPGFVGLNCAGRECPYGRALSDVPTLMMLHMGTWNAQDNAIGTTACVCYAGTEGQACSN